MKRLTQIFQALLGVVALILTAIIAFGRLAWRTIRSWWKDRPKWVRYSLAAPLILVPTGFVLLVVCVICHEEFGRDYYDRWLSKDVALHSFADNKWRVYNHRIGEYTTEKINWLSEVSEGDSLAVYAIPGKRGFINARNGEVVIDARANQYQKAWIFSDGVAAVMQDGKIGFVNAMNEVVIPFQFDYTDKCRMWNFGYVFHDGYCAMPDSEGDLGLIDLSGRWVVNPEYDEIWAPLHNGYRVVIQSGRYGLLDAACREAYPVEYDYLEVHSEGIVLTKDGRKWQVDFEGNVTHPFLFDATYYLKYPDGYNECDELLHGFADYVKYEVMDSYGILNRITGDPITPAIYSDINMLSEDLFEVRDPTSDSWILLDKHGRMVVAK